MRTKPIYIAVFIFAMLQIVTNDLNAQITIGAKTAPGESSILQLEKAESERGFRLPRLTQAQCNTLKTNVTGKTPANGLVIYNTTTNKIQYWDGVSNDWIILDYKKLEFVGENGVTALSSSAGGYQLGGTLKDNTTVTVGANTLNFPTATGKQFVVSSTTDFMVADNKVGIGTATPARSLEVNNTSSSVKGLRISNSGEGPDYLLASDANGNGTWQPLKPLSSIVKGEIDNNISFNKNSGEPDPVISSQNITLDKGKWLIMAKFTAKRSGGANTESSIGLYTYGALRYKDTANNEQIAISIGTLAEQLDSSIDRYATPQIFYYVELAAADAPRTYYITAGTSASESPHNSNNWTTSEYGGSYFYAIRIDKID
jgi:hypothetical protein